LGKRTPLLTDDGETGIAKMKPRMKNKKSLVSLLLAIVFALVAGAYVLINPTSPTPPTPPRTPAVSATLAPISDLDTMPAAARVELFSFPETDEQVLLDRIASARSRVWMKMYLLTDPRVIDALVQARNNGADVRAMVEQNPFGGGSSARQAFDKLNAAGINTKYANPVFRFTHEKSFIIDDTIFILTANMTKSAFSRNREFGIIHVDSGDVGEAVAAYNADWSREKFTPQRSQSALVWSPVNARPKLMQLVGAAQTSLLVYAELAQDDPIIDALIQAQKRGVQVRFLISPSSQGEDDDANKVDLDKLQRGKVKVRYLKSPYMHAKAFLADDTLAYIGSINLSTGSMEFNRELGILFKDRTALRLLDEIFEKDWNKATER